MSVLNIEKQYLLSTKVPTEDKLTQVYITNELGNEIVVYHIFDNLTKDFNSILQLTDYDNLQCNNLKKRLTARAVSQIGVKSFPGIGSYGYFKYKYSGLSMILAPINIKQKKFKPPLISMITTDAEITFTISAPEGITYSSYRMILRNDAFTYEYITYELGLTVPKPTVIGNYVITCIGYVDEGEYISYESNELYLEVLTGYTSFSPDPNISYYTKTQTDALLEEIELLPGIDGIDATYYKIVMNTYTMAKSNTGIYTPTTITATLQTVTGSAAPILYAGRIVISDTVDGINYTNRYISSTNESSKTYTPSADIKGLRIRAYLAGGTTTLFDETSVAIVSDGEVGITQVRVDANTQYYKYSDGRLEVYQRVPYTVDINVVFGSWYVSAPTGIVNPNYPIAFVGDYPYIQKSVETTSGNAVIFSFSDPQSLTRAQRSQLIRATPATNCTGFIHIYAVGRWK